MGGCSPSKEPAPGAEDKTLTGVPGANQNEPLLNKSYIPNVSGALGDFKLMYDATPEQQAAADIVLAMPLVEETGEVPPDGGVAIDPLESQRMDLLHRITRSGLSYTSMLSADQDEAFIIIQADEERLMECAEFSFFEMRLKKSWKVPYAPFTIGRKDDFQWEDRANGRVFSTRDRQSLIMRILETGNFASADEMVVTAHDNRDWKSKYGTNKHPTCGLNMDFLVSEGVIDGYWAMHGKGRHTQLVSAWGYAFWSSQPLPMIFEYFNSKTALYFAFIGYYSVWLAVSCIFGIIVAAYDLHLAFSASTATPAPTPAPSPGVEAAPVAAAGDDNVITCFYAFFMALWGTLFLEFWKRYNAELAYKWSTLNLQQEASERVEFGRACTANRQGFYAAGGQFVPFESDLEPSGCGSVICSCGMSFNDDVTEDVDAHTQARIKDFAPPDVPYMDEGTRCKRMCLTFNIAIIFTSLVLVILMSFLVMRLIFQAMLDASTGGLVASSMQAAVTVGLNAIYLILAEYMVDYENWRTDDEWENAIVYKVFGFQFINSYFSLFYVAFLKGKIGKLDGYSDKCKDANGVESDNCMQELYTLLLSTLLVVQIASAVGESLVPYFKFKILMWAEQAKWRHEGNTGPLLLSDIDHESKLTPPLKLDTFNDYNKMALQFGYVSMFVAAFPLAPLCGLANNVVEIRTDALKRLLAMQRPTPSERAEDIGAWMQILELMSLAAVATNVGVLCFTSTKFASMMNLNDTQRVWAFVILEHIIICVKLFLSYSISDVPEWVTLRVARDAYMLTSRDLLIEKEQLALAKSQQTLLSIGGVTLETDGAKAPMTSSAVSSRT